MKRLLIITSIFLFAAAGVYLLGDKGSTHQASAQTQNTDWPQFRRDAKNSGFQPGSTIPTNSTFYNNATWEYVTPDAFSDTAEPVSAEGVIALGSLQGNIFVLNKTNGQTIWTKSVDGGIYGSLAIANGKVISADYSGHLKAFSTTNGNLVWSYKANGSFMVPPTVENGVVYAGSGDGVMHAVNAETGQGVWQFQVGGSTDSGAVRAPIKQPAAVFGGRVFFGAENMYAYGLDAGSGNLLWKRRLTGQSFVHGWPVASSQNGGVIVFRTQPIYTFHSHLGADEAEIKRVTGVTDIGALGNFSAWNTEQAAISQWLKNNPHRRTFWELNPATGADKYSLPMPILYTAGIGDTPAPPVVDDAGGRAWVTARSVYARLDTGGMVRQYGDLVKLNFNFNPSVYTNSSLGEGALGMQFFPCFNNQQGCLGWDVIHKVSDEGEILTGFANGILSANWVSFGAFDLTRSDGFGYWIAHYTSADNVDKDSGVNFIVANKQAIFKETREDLQSQIRVFNLP